MAGIARVTAPYRCGPGRARRGAICKIGPRPGQTLLALRAFGGGRADPRRPMAMPATVFAVVVTSIGCKATRRSEEHTSELQSLMRISYAVFCLKKKNTTTRCVYVTHIDTAPQYVGLQHNRDTTEI